MQVTTLVKGALIALLATTAASANAANSVNATYNFENVASGSTANSALGDDFSFMHFANPDIEADLVGDGYHWIDASSTYGNILVQNDAASGSNVISNPGEPILLLFTGLSNVSSFSVNYVPSAFNFGSKSVLFLDANYHTIANSEVFADSNNLITITGPQYNVTGILLTAGGSYDNLSISAVPESDTYAMLLAGLGIVGFVARRRS